MGPSRCKETGDGPLFAFTHQRGDRRRERLLCRAHVLAVPCGFVEAGAGSGIGQVAANAQALEVIKYVLGLSVGQQHGSIFAHMREVVRRQRVAGLNRTVGYVLIGPQAENDTRRHLRLCGGGDGTGAQRQRLQLAGVCLEVLRQVDAEIGQRQVGNGDAGR